LVGKTFDQVKNPSKCLLVVDNTLCAYSQNLNPFEISYWHDQKRLGCGGAAFVDARAAYVRVTRDQPDWKRGANWTFVFNDP